MRDKILFVDDDTNLLQSIQRNFRRSYECAVAADADEALKILESGDRFSVVVADYRMPGNNGIDFLRKSMERFPDTIRIMLTGYADMETALKAINQSRVFSFLQKPFDTGDLKTVLEEASKEHHRIQRIHMDSLTDPLTGLYNRRFIEREYARLMELARRQDSRLAVVFADIDNFKEVNDRYGHSAGDLLLSAIAETLAGTIRGSDLLCRYGGDEFVILMDSADIEHAHRLSERIVENVSALCIREMQDMNFSISLGQSAFPQDGETMNELLIQADKRMYMHKVQH
ncbi:diguanylate cyclase [Salinispira pacifica]|uniref:diguanylate cyclase n=1 Tax=Salinispira pacifica TaxID=1307761 RepID=V5WLS4_9SPIO|nr:diguanylate cyclase [Salinispira pacifica]AHC16565.1 hypothetical protein L21SP2_3225 [Salinispira pacifica]